MDEERLAAEKRGFEYLGKLVKKLRLDADQVADEIRASLESRNPMRKAKNQGRIKEKYLIVFAVTKEEYRKSSLRVRGKSISMPIYESKPVVKQRTEQAGNIEEPKLSTFIKKASEKKHVNKKISEPLTKQSINLTSNNIP